MSKLKEQFLAALKDVPRVRVEQENSDRIIGVFIKGFEEDEGWCCYDAEDDEIRINGKTGIRTNYKEVWISSDYSYDGCIIVKSIKKFKKYLKFALGLAAIFEQTTKQIKNLQRLDKMEDDF